MDNKILLVRGYQAFVDGTQIKEATHIVAIRQWVPFIREDNYCEGIEERPVTRGFSLYHFDRPIYLGEDLKVFKFELMHFDKAVIRRLTRVEGIENYFIDKR
jgi:hypothetical protein